jgi:Domain of unknown function (DUF4378)
METQFDPWVTSNWQLSRSGIKDAMQHSNSSQVIGRKINSYHKINLKSSRDKKERATDLPIMLSKNNTSRCRNISLSKSPIRSQSQKKSKKIKDSKDIPHYVSPLRQTRKTKEPKKQFSKSIKSESKHEKQKASNIKAILTESLNKNHLEKLENKIKVTEEMIKKETKKEKIKLANKRIRKKNAKVTKVNLSKHPRPWGSDQRALNEDLSKSAENGEIRARIRAEREASKRQGRKAIGLDLYPNSKSRPKNKIQDEKPKYKRSPDPNIIKYMKQKNKTRKIIDLQKQLEESVKERERIQGLEKLDKTLRKKQKKPKKKKRSKPCWLNDEKSTEVNFSLSNGHKKKLTKDRTIVNSRENSDLLTERFKNLEERVYNTYDIVKIEAAIKIQRWWRSSISTRLKKTIKNHNRFESNSSSDKYLKTECEEWFSFLNPSTKYKEFNRKISDRFKEKTIEKSPDFDNLRPLSRLGNKISGSSKSSSIESSPSSDSANFRTSSRNENSSKEPQLSQSIHNFQVKRPKELNIEIINTPLISKTYESPASSEVIERHFTNQDSLGSFKLKNSLTFQKSEKSAQKTKLDSSLLFCEASKSDDSDPSYLGNTEKSAHKIKFSNENSESVIVRNSDNFMMENPENTQIEDFVIENTQTQDFVIENTQTEDFVIENPENTQIEDFVIGNFETPVAKNSMNFIEENSKKNSDIHSNRSKNISNELSLHSFQINIEKKEDLSISEKDSLENDISEISSALLNNKEGSQLNLLSIIEDKPIDFIQNLGFNIIANFESPTEKTKTVNIIPNKAPLNSDEQLELKTSNCPISSPNLSYSIDDLILEILENEVTQYIQEINFTNKEKDINPNNSFLEFYLNSMANELQNDEEEILEAINTPGYQEPLIKLRVLQQTEVGCLSKFPNLELILPLDLCSQMKSKLKSLGVPARQIYLQMVFDCVNEALNYIRPFGVKGMPDPWSSYPKTLFGEAELKSVFEKLCSLMKKWGEIKGGAYANQDIRDDEDKLQTLREERMSALLCNDVKDEEPVWIDYQDEEAQAKFDLGEIIFEILLDETINLLN